MPRQLEEKATSRRHFGRRGNPSPDLAKQTGTKDLQADLQDHQFLVTKTLSGHRLYIVYKIGSHPLPLLTFPVPVLIRAWCQKCVRLWRLQSHVFLHLQRSFCSLLTSNRTWMSFELFSYRLQPRLEQLIEDSRAMG